MTYQTTDYGVDRHVSREIRPSSEQGYDELTRTLDGAQPYGPCHPQQPFTPDHENDRFRREHGADRHAGV